MRHTTVDFFHEPQVRTPQSLRPLSQTAPTSPQPILDRQATLAFFQQVDANVQDVRKLGGPQPASDWFGDLHPDPQFPQKPAARGPESLRKSLGLGTDWKGAEQAKRLLDVLNGSFHVITDRFGSSFQEPQKSPEECMQRLAERHGLSTLNKICGNLLQFIQEAESKGWPSWDAVRLVRFALEDIGNPSVFDQRNKGTCAAVSVQAKLAAERPEQYIKMLTQLALDKPYKTPEGKQVRPNQTWRGDTSDDRRPTDKLMQSAIMSMAKKYDSSKDDGENNTGLNRIQQTEILQTLFGESEEVDTDGVYFGTGLEKRYLWRLIEDDLARGRTVSVSFDGHAVQVVGVDKTTTPPNVLIATWGQRKIMSLPRFLEHLRTISSIDDPGLDNRQVQGRRDNT